MNRVIDIKELKKIFRLVDGKIEKTRSKRENILKEETGRCLRK